MLSPSSWGVWLSSACALLVFPLLTLDIALEMVRAVVAPVGEDEKASRAEVPSGTWSWSDAGSLLGSGLGWSDSDGGGI